MLGHVFCESLGIEGAPKPSARRNTQPPGLWAKAFQDDLIAERVLCNVKFKHPWEWRIVRMRGAWAAHEEMNPRCHCEGASPDSWGKPNIRRSGERSDRLFMGKAAAAAYGRLHNVYSPGFDKVSKIIETV
jgi:hypothetical protein